MFATSIVVAFAVAFATPGIATEIRLKGGQTISNAKIASKTAASWRVQTKFGTVAVPVNSIESVDGKPFGSEREPAPNTAATGSSTSATGSAPALPPAVRAEASPTPAPDSNQSLLEAPLAPGKSEPVTVAQPAPPTTVPNAATSLETPASDDPSAPSAIPANPATPAPLYKRDPSFDWFLGACAAVFFLWMGVLVWVQKDLLEHGRSAEGWNTVVAMVPGLGFVVYFVGRFFGKSGRNAAENRTILKQQGLFKRDAKSRRVNLRFLEEDRTVFGGPIEEGSALESARLMLEDAIEARASDIHIEPQELDHRVRFRVDGALVPTAGFSRNEGMRVVSALKTLAQIDVAERRKAQDGRFRVTTNLREVDFRVATANSIFGEKLVIRILDRKSGVFDLSELGMAPAVMDRFHQTIQSRAGMIVATGPTGSGKTSTLYAALGKLDASKLNIMTIEDPVEYELGGATQIPVNAKAGVTYESGLRSILRQDPDVIFVGEMRDAEAASIAVRASLTGHLVFTTLHTKDALSTLIRLEEMGLNRTTLSSAMLMLLAQRLVRVLCENCKEPYSATGTELGEIGIELPAGATLFRAKGCNACGDTGYFGRSGIFELVIFDDGMRAAVSSGADYETMTRMAHERGFESYREDGARKALAGLTTVEEILEAT
jgi:general secretion pathway protein E